MCESAFTLAENENKNSDPVSEVFVLPCITKNAKRLSQLLFAPPDFFSASDIGPQLARKHTRRLLMHDEYRPAWRACAQLAGAAAFQARGQMEAFVATKNSEIC